MGTLARGEEDERKKTKRVVNDRRSERSRRKKGCVMAGPGQRDENLQSEDSLVGKGDAGELSKERKSMGRNVPSRKEHFGEEKTTKMTHIEFRELVRSVSG